LFKVSRDGDRISTFTEKVSGKSPTLIIIQSKSGNKFGGYTSVEWKMTGRYSYKNDKYAFIFSIDKRKKFKLKKEEYEFVEIIIISLLEGDMIWLFGINSQQMIIQKVIVIIIVMRWQSLMN